MLRNIPIGLKIVTGFLILLILMALVAYLGKQTVDRSVAGFDTYRSLATESQDMAELQAALLQLRADAQTYIIQSRQEDIKVFTAQKKNTLNIWETAYNRAGSEDLKELLNQVSSNLNGYLKDFDGLIQVESKVADKIEEMNRFEEIAEANFSLIINSDFDDNSPSLPQSCSQAFMTFLQAKVSFFNYISNKSTQALEETQLNFEVLDMQMEQIDFEINNSITKDWLVKAMESAASFKESLDALSQLYKNRENIILELQKRGEAAIQSIEAASSAVREQQDTLGPTLQEQQAKDVKNMLATSLIAVIVGLALAILMSISLSRPLKRAMEFSRHIANGNFNAHLDIKGRDEIAQLAQAMEQIPETLNKVLTEFQSMVEIIQLGKLAYRSDSTAFQGAYAELINGANILADRLQGIIDHSPFPVMTVDTSHRILYMNKAGAKVGGNGEATSLLETNCFDYFKTNDCKTPNCVCTQSMEKNSPVEAEVIAIPLEDKMKLTAFARPLLNTDGKIVGAIEFIVDQTDIRTIQETMQNVAQQAIQISEGLSSASEELAAQTDQISKSAENQQERMAEMTAAMEEMHTTVMEVAKNAGEAAVNSDDAKNKAQDGAKIVGRSVASIKALDKTTDTLQIAMTDLGERAQAIGKVMVVISDIADQTNLLALNAAIEAARAGEAGRGFAVVADEVRKLAEKTMAATSEVENSIHAIQQSAKDNLEHMTEARGAVSQAADLAGEAGKSLSEIVRLVESNAMQVSNIATAAEEQSASSDEVSRTLEEFNVHVAETSEAMIQSARAVQELSAMAGDLNDLIVKLR